MSRSALKRWRDRHLLLADAVSTIAAVAGCLAIGAMVWTAEDALVFLDGSRAALYTTLAAVAGSLLGFVLTAVSIIAAFGQMPRFASLRRSPKYEAIFGIYFSATHVLALMTVWTILGLVLDTDKTRLGLFSCGTLLITGLAVARVYRCVWAMEQMVKIAATPLTDAQPVKESSAG